MRSGQSRIFTLSLKFLKLDDGARVYGTFIYGSLHEVGQAHDGIGLYARVVGSEPKEVRQRIRDFLRYALHHDKQAAAGYDERKLNGDWLVLFPADYVFGAGDALFVARANHSPDPTPASPTPAAGKPPRQP